MDYRALAVSFMDTTHPKEKRRPPTETEQYEHVKDGTIRYLYEHNCTATPPQLIDFFGFSPARLTKILRELEADGLILRCPDTVDRRRITVHLTERGMDYAVEKRNRMIDRLTEIFTLLGEDDARHFVRITEKLLNSLSCGDS